MEPLGVTAARALQSMLSQQPNTSAKVAFAWTIAAGATLARAATVQWSPDGTLLVRARTEAWQQEITRARSVIRARLETLLGPDVVRKVTVTS